jgi:hypothetical protein
MQNDSLPPLQSLQLIESMINKAKNNFADNGFLYLLWGYTICFCALFHYACIQWQLHIIPRPEMIWMLTWLVGIFQAIYLRKKDKQRTAKTYTEDIISYIWITFAVCAGVATFIVLNVFKLNNWIFMYPIILMLYGMPTFLSGVVMQFTPLKIGGVVCWLLAIICTFTLNVNALLLVAVAVIAAWIIPGYLLQKKYKQHHTTS